MTYLRCEACGLALAARWPQASPKHCPRCLARRRKVVEMLASEEPNTEVVRAPARSLNLPRPTKAGGYATA
jgi:hypothetical protein